MHHYTIFQVIARDIALDCVGKFVFGRILEFSTVQREGHQLPPAVMNAMVSDR